MSLRRIGPLFAVLGFIVASWLLGASPAAAQYAQFQTGRFTTTPITFDLGGGVIGTVTLRAQPPGAVGFRRRP